MSESMTTCPHCQKKSAGRFCTYCGGALGSVHCNQCGAASEPGGRFCNSCGAPLGAGMAAAGAGAGRAGAGTGTDTSSDVRVPWMVAGGLLVVLILAVAVPAIMRGGGVGGVGTPDAPTATGTTGGALPDISQMTPREAADRLYRRVMIAAEAGDSAQVTQFLPMTLDAYEIARPLDADGLFHLALLQRMALDSEAALASAQEALAVHPNHLLNLAAAAGASADLGDDATAREPYQMLLDQFDAEMGKLLPEYDAHSQMMPELKAEAEAYLAG